MILMLLRFSSSNSNRFVQTKNARYHQNRRNFTTNVPQLIEMLYIGDFENFLVDNPHFFRNIYQKILRFPPIFFRSIFDHNLTIKMIARQRRIFWYVSRKKCGFSTKKFSKSPLLIQKCIFYLNWAILVAVIVVWNFKKS